MDSPHPSTPLAKAFAVGLNSDLKAALPVGSRFVVGVSGGLDSVVLLDLLNSYRERASWEIIVAHAHHGLRGVTADADAEWVEQHAKGLGLECHCRILRDASPVDQGRESVEMRARRLRHAFLASMARECGASRVVLAHHGDDQIELVFLRLFRGAGGTGLGGMAMIAPSPADPAIQLVRPLLAWRRADIIDHAQRVGLSFRTDESNFNVNIPRNKWRHEILPYLRSTFGSGFEAAVLRTSEIVRDEADCILEQARVWMEKRAPSVFEELPVAVQRAVMRERLWDLGIPVDFDLVERLRRGPGQAVSVAPGQQIIQEGGSPRNVSPAPSLAFNDRCTHVHLDSEEGAVELGDAKFEWRRVHCSKSADPGVRGETPGGWVGLDAGRTGVYLILRYWQPGDRFQPPGFPKPSKLQNIFTNRKIPVTERRERLLLEHEELGIVWVEGLPVPTLVKLEETPREGLWVRVVRGKSRDS